MRLDPCPSGGPYPDGEMAVRLITLDPVARLLSNFSVHSQVSSIRTRDTWVRADGTRRAFIRTSAPPSREQLARFDRPLTTRATDDVQPALLVRQVSRRFDREKRAKSETEDQDQRRVIHCLQPSPASPNG
ncbi:unnamed protein product [Arctogadus glacialis]